MGFFRFLGRHVGASVVGAVGVTVAALGYWDQAKDILTAFDAWQLQASGAFLFVVSVVMILYRWDQERAEQETARLVPAHAPTPVPAPVAVRTAAQSRPGSPPQSKSGRVYVGENVTPVTLISLFKGKTSVQADRLIRPYIGKWIRVTGIVGDVAMPNPNYALVQFKQIDFSDIANFERNQALSSITMEFKKDLDRLEILQGGEIITVDGQIEMVMSATFTIKNCEIVSIEATPS